MLTRSLPPPDDVLDSPPDEEDPELDPELPELEPELVVPAEPRLTAWPCA
jgi:hypothetical protein